MLPRRGADEDLGEVVGMSSTLPQMLERRRSRFAQESFSSVVMFQSCLCSGSSSMGRSSSMAVREPPVVTRPEDCALVGIHSPAQKRGNQGTYEGRHRPC
jgi:hypothetical protein